MDDELIGKLKGLGLTEYETKAYIALLSLQKAKAAEIAETSGIPRSRIYDVLNGLRGKGWLFIEEGKPAHYVAIQPQYAVYAAAKAEKARVDRTARAVLKRLEQTLYPDKIPAEVHELAESQDIRTKTTPPRFVAYTIHKGPYHLVGQTYLKVWEWIKENNYEIVGPPMDLYWNNPREVSNPEEWLTEVQIEIRPSFQNEVQA